MNEYSFFQNAYYKDVHGNARKNIFTQQIVFIDETKEVRNIYKRDFRQEPWTFLNEEGFIYPDGHKIYNKKDKP